MDNRRFITFLVFFFSFTWLYTNLIIPKFFPPPPEPQLLEETEPVATEPAVKGEDVQKVAGSDNAAGAVEGGVAVNEPEAHPRRSVVLGSEDPESGYFLAVQLSSMGAAIESIKLSDPKFRDLRDENQQVQVLGNNLTEDRTFSLAIAAIDQQLEPHKLKSESIDWEVVEADSDAVTFSLKSPNGLLKVEKTFRIQKVDVPPDQRVQAFRTEATGFTLHLDVKGTNLSAQPLSFDYELQGPVGVILENEEHTRKYQDIKIEFLGEDDDVILGSNAVKKLYDAQVASARAAGKAVSDRQIRENLRQSEPWTGALRYAGIDVQFFAALVAPLDDRPEADRIAGTWIDRTYPVLIHADLINNDHSEISFRMATRPWELGADEATNSVTHKYALYVGPKRSDLLDPEPMRADQVLDYGSWFGFIARRMHWLLDSFYQWGMPYALAIICLTVLVRGAMFPLSRKQAISAARMKDLQPKLNELKLQYGDKKEELARAQMELWRKHNINPLGGCLPLFFQLPIFVALYTCLNTAVDLRLSRFLWIENLAAPDAIFRLGTALPVLGNDFNLLPCITVVLFYVQQKMFMPPPADEQQAAQQKMMNIMTLFFGFMFWHMPAGLCLYFIASSLWGIAERTLLGSTSSTTEPFVVVKEAVHSKSNSASKEKNQPPAKLGFFGKLMEAAEEAQRQAGKSQNHKKENRGKDRK